MQTALKVSAICAAFILASGVGAETASDPVVGTVMTGVNAEVVTTTGYRATQLLESGIFNENGDNIGKLEDFIVGSDDNITIAIVGVGGFLGVDERMVAIPVESLKMNEQGQLVLSGASKEQLEALPAFVYVD